MNITGIFIIITSSVTSKFIPYYLVQQPPRRCLITREPNPPALCQDKRLSRVQKSHARAWVGGELLAEALETLKFKHSKISIRRLCGKLFAESQKTIKTIHQKIRSIHLLVLIWRLLASCSYMGSCWQKPWKHSKIFEKYSKIAIRKLKVSIMWRVVGGIPGNIKKPNVYYSFNIMKKKTFKNIHQKIKSIDLLVLIWSLEPSKMIRIIWRLEPALFCLWNPWKY